MWETPLVCYYLVIHVLITVCTPTAAKQTQGQQNKVCRAGPAWMCESVSDLGLLIPQHYLRDFVEIVTGLISSVFSFGVHTRDQSSNFVLPRLHVRQIWNVHSVRNRV